ncbi:division/cell wall cluster transcriptional repressor MraZ [Alphaproteobacteria bacterium KMM 3653]|uniref:Transcriptional regulator MraZ n=1 Tax=Harenicola maris TaxID=2841044 RepID=A0AAP2CLW2_9RHOB|nr:division/cell wall cluster transcriptional repressor MraZ [Harenicola maris]
MGQRFRGEGHHKVDAKGRVSIPALFRRVLASEDPDCQDGQCPNLVIVYGDDRQDHLKCFTVNAINEIDDGIAAMQRGSKERRYLERLYSGLSHPTSVDETGRLVLPAKLREKIGLDGEAFFIATGDTFQIWKPEDYEAKHAQSEDWLDDMGDDFDPLSLLGAGAEG